MPCDNPPLINLTNHMMTRVMILHSLNWPTIHYYVIIFLHLTHENPSLHFHVVVALAELQPPQPSHLFIHTLATMSEEVRRSSCTTDLHSRSHHKPLFFSFTMRETKICDATQRLHHCSWTYNVFLLTQFNNHGNNLHASIITAVNANNPTTIGEPAA